MSIQNMHYAARISGIGQKFVNAVKDEDLLGAKSIAETALYLNAGEEVKNSVEGAVERSGINRVDENMMGGMGGMGGTPLGGTPLPSGNMQRPAPQRYQGSPSMPSQQLDPATVAAMMQMFQQMAMMSRMQQGQGGIPLPNGNMQRPAAARPQMGPRPY